MLVPLAGGVQGGAIYASGGTLTITRAQFTNNQAAQKSGGAIYASRGTLTITHAQFTNNQAKQYGGGVISIATSILLDVSFSGNKPDGFNCNRKTLLSNTHTSMTTKYTKC